jgi:ADP-ribosylation factor GTPase-activating protein 2/3
LCELIGFNVVQIEESREARQKFSKAKSISSSQFFGDQASFEKDAQVSLQKFSVSTTPSLFHGHHNNRYHVGSYTPPNFNSLQGSSAISSADLFGHPANNSSVDLSASDLINRISFQVTSWVEWILFSCCACVNALLCLSWQATQDLSSLKNMAGETGKKLTSMASNIITDLQDRIL